LAPEIWLRTRSSRPRADRRRLGVALFRGRHRAATRR